MEIQFFYPTLKNIEKRLKDKFLIEALETLMKMTDFNKEVIGFPQKKNILLYFY